MSYLQSACSLSGLIGLSCDECGEAFQTSDELQGHIDVEHEGKLECWILQNNIHIRAQFWDSVLAYVGISSNWDFVQWWLTASQERTTIRNE